MTSQYAWNLTFQKIVGIRATSPHTTRKCLLRGFLSKLVPAPKAAETEERYQDEHQAAEGDEQAAGALQNLKVYKT